MAQVLGAQISWCKERGKSIELWGLVQFLAILTAIEVEASHCHRRSASSSKLGNKGRELKKVGV